MLNTTSIPLIAKSAFKLVSNLGVAKIVHDIIDAHVVSESTFDTIKVWAGTAVIVGAITTATDNYIDTTYDEYKESLNSIKESVQEARATD